MRIGRGKFPDTRYPGTRMRESDATHPGSEVRVIAPLLDSAHVSDYSDLGRADSLPGVRSLYDKQRCHVGHQT